ncbi:hypothetical protein K439DRAFT_1613720 [Ramaria rubella]|nr:hypothetical protein K439DRAFT_1613720 [Ramaria rubella]
MHATYLPLTFKDILTDSDIDMGKNDDDSSLSGSNSMDVDDDDEHLDGSDNGNNAKKKQSLQTRTGKRRLHQLHKAVMRVENKVDKLRKARIYDAEEDGGHKKPSSTSRRGGGPKKQGGRRNTGQQHDIRKHTLALMQLESPIQWLPDGPTNKEAMTNLSVLKPLRLHWESDNSSMWNRRAINILLADFLAIPKHGCDEDDESNVIAFTKQHFKGLRQKYKHQVDLAAGNLKVIQEYSRGLKQGRKLKVYYSRLGACRRHPDLKKHVPVLLDLGVNGMSTDCSDEEDGEIVYKIRKHTWHSPLVTPWLRAMNSIHKFDRLNGVTHEKRRGATMHRRQDWNVTSTGAPVPGLPKNLYHEPWLKSLDPFENKHLKVKPTEYELSHSDDILQIQLRPCGPQWFHG